MNWIQRQSLKIAITYVALAGLWIILSDAVLLDLSPRWAPETLSTINSLKGLGFVLVTAGLLYWMVRRSLTRQEKGESQYRALIDHAPIAMLIYAADRVQYANAAALHLFRAENPEQLVGCGIQQLVPPASRNTVRLRMNRLRETGLPAPPLAQELLRLDGSVVQAEVAALPVQWDGAPAIQVVINDLSEAAAYAARLSHITTHDLLTDLPNRTLLHDRLSQEIIHAGRIQRISAVLVMDVARLQSVNDSYGFEAGDELLRALADNLREAVRPGDTVARISGDQFAVLLADLHDRSGLLTAIEKVRTGAAHTYTVAGKEVYVTLHSGAAVWPGDGEDAEALLGNAVTACNRAKKSGSIDTEFYAPSLSQISLDHLKIDMSFIRDIARSENDARITQAIITLGHGLDMEVIAEGVETAEQARLLEIWGCDIFQGYYFGRPVDAAQFTRMLDESKEFSWKNEHSPGSPATA